MKKLRGVYLGRAAYWGVVAVALGVAAQPVQAKVRASIDTDVRLSYDSNPFLSTGDNLSSGSVTAGVQPKLTYSDVTNDVTLTGDYDRTEYFRRYDGTDAYGGGLDARHRFSPGTDAFVSLRYDSNVIGQYDDTLANNAGIPPIDDTDINLIGTRQRSSIYSANAGFNAKLSPKDSISGNVGATASRYPGRAQGADSNNYGGSLSYSRAISERSRVGLSGSVYYIDYDLTGLHTMVMQPAVTFSTQLSPTWSFDASIGVSFSDLSVPGLDDRKDTSISGSANICHKGRLNRLCLSGSRQVSGSGFGGTTERDQIAFNFQQTLTDKLSANAGGGYARSTSQNGLFGRREYVNLQGGLDYRLTRRLTIGADARYRDVYGAGIDVDADIGGSLSAKLALPGPS